MFAPVSVLWYNLGGKGVTKMDFSKITDCICPLLSIGQKEAVECQKNCMLYNPDTHTCDLTAIGFLRQETVKDDL